MSQPPVRTGYAAFTAHGSRNREFVVTSISSGFHRVHGVQLARSLSTLYRFPTLFLRAFAMYVACPHADYYAQSDCLEGLGRFGAGLPCLLPLSFASLGRVGTVDPKGMACPPPRTVLAPFRRIRLSILGSAPEAYLLAVSIRMTFFRHGTQGLSPFPSASSFRPCYHVLYCG